MFRPSRDVPYQPRCKKCQRAKMNCRCAEREAERRRERTFKNVQAAGHAGLETATCRPVRQGSDEYRCLTCGRVWDTHEAKPECERDKT